MMKINKGQCVKIILKFDNEQISIDLRRVNNEAGHLQFRYERKEHQHFRDYLLQLTHKSQLSDGCVIDIIEVTDRVFQVTPIAGLKSNNPILSIYEPVCHLTDDRQIKDSSEFQDIVESLSKIAFVPNHSQRDYNLLISNALIKREWLPEKRVHNDIGLKCDFFKHGVWLEVEFGNARSYYQDYIKFLIAARYHEYNFAVLLCPTASFAGYLCELGKQRAKRNVDCSVNVSYSGMMTYEKAIRELPFIEHIIRENIVIAGVDIRDLHYNKTRSALM